MSVTNKRNKLLSAVRLLCQIQRGKVCKGQSDEKAAMSEVFKHGIIASGEGRWK